MRIIDGNNLLHRTVDRVSYGVHPVRELYTRFCSPQETTVIVWDGPYANKRRQKIFPEYKANRRPKEESKFELFEVAKAVLRFTPTIQVEIPGWEADDIIGTMINHWYQKYPLVVETNDGDYWQHRDKCKLPLVTKKWHHMSADECLLYKSTVGDAKDNIPGMKGFGINTWDRLSPEARRHLLVAAKLEDQDKFFTLESLPKRLITLENFGNLCMSWKLNNYIPVPMDEIDSHMVQGKQNLKAAEIFMEGYLI